MNPQELTAELEKGRIRPAYLLAGQEPLLREESLAALGKATLEPATRDFNLDRLPGNTTSAASLRNFAETLPVMAKHRLVVLAEPDNRRASSRALMESLVDLLADLVLANETVLVVTARKVDRRSRWVTAFSEPATLVDCDVPTRGGDIAHFIADEAQRQGLEWGPGAAHYLAELVGPQMLLLRQEIAKISLLVSPGEKATRHHVALSTHAVAEQPIWDLTDAIGEGNTAVAIERLAKLSRHGSPAPVVLASLATHFRKLLRAADGGTLSGPNFVVRKIKQQASRYSVQKLEACLGFIQQTDVAIKGGSELGEGLAMERLVIALAT